MSSPSYKDLRTRRGMLSDFRGLCLRDRIGAGQFCDMRNMSAERFPLLSPRVARVYKEARTDEEEEEIRLNGIDGGDGLTECYGDTLYRDGETVADLTLIDNEKAFVRMGANLLIFPDQKYYNTQTGASGTIGTVTAQTGDGKYVVSHQHLYSGWENNPISFVVKSGASYITVGCDGSGNSPADITLVPSDGSTAVSYSSVSNSTEMIIGIYEKPPRTTASVFTGNANQMLICCTRKGIYYAYKATAREGSNSRETWLNYTVDEWRKLNLQYTKLRTIPITYQANSHLYHGGVQVTIEKNSDTEYRIYNENIGDFIDSFFRRGNADTGRTTSFRMTGYTYQTTPLFDFVCEHGNRLYGCRYGAQGASSHANEIYISALGNFADYTTGTGAGDAWSCTVGAPGRFTGCAEYRGYVLFFKEDAVYKLLGEKPSNFQCAKIGDVGVQKDCAKSLCEADGVLYYKSRDGIYAFTGARPRKVSDDLGAWNFAEAAVAGAIGGRYYVCLTKDGQKRLFVYDTRRGLWHAEDDADCRFFAVYDGKLYAAIGNREYILSGTGEGFTAEGAVKWSATTGELGLDTPERKYYRRIGLRYAAPTGSRITVEVFCDGEGSAGKTVTLPGRGIGSDTVDIPITRCDTVKIRLSGVGDAKIYSIYYETEDAV